MTFQNNGAFVNTNYTVVAVAARNFNNGALAPWGNQGTGTNLFFGAYAYGGGDIGTGLAVGYNNTGSDAQGNYCLTQYGPTLSGGSPPLSGTMGGGAGPETAEVITAALNTAVGQSISVNGTTIASNGSTTPIGVSGGTTPNGNPDNYTSYLGTGNAEPDEGFFNGDLGEVVIFTTALTTAQQQAVNAYLQYKWLGVGPAVAAPSFLTNGYGMLPSTTPVIISGGGTLDLNNSRQTVGSLSSSDPTTQVLLGSGTLTVGTDNTSTTFAGAISDSGSGGGLIKTGSGASRSPAPTRTPAARRSAAARSTSLARRPRPARAS